MEQTTKLLVSVRSAAEARLAIEGGTDIIDVKQPSRGSLGQPDEKVVSEIVEVIQGKVPCSVALGEWRESKPMQLPKSISWAKVGLAGVSNTHERQQAWLAWLKAQRSFFPVQLVGVVYADQLRSGSIKFGRMLEWMIGVQQACETASGILVDTFIKDGRGLLYWQSLDKIRRWQKQCRQHGLFLALAGSLTLRDVSLLVKQVQPDVIAARGAACAGGARGASVQADRVRSLARCLRASS